ncbi:hypothetical protein NDU88_005400 [Pleurodeles waltl]|uniref:Uncharacterized protein n=1 Tax=Pleurodeles waltl TaxID=8319 RepID=A0AAV7RKY4_PLEWA|nr:hypothetical protein NDU88_005400 [Pleurodeles waltl]
MARGLPLNADTPGKPRLACRSRQGALTAGSAQKRGMGVAGMSSMGQRGKDKGRGLGNTGRMGLSRRAPAEARRRRGEVEEEIDLPRVGKRDGLAGVRAGTCTGASVWRQGEVGRGNKGGRRTRRCAAASEGPTGASFQKMAYYITVE